jgi:SAM-dependent methyltransferase
MKNEFKSLKSSIVESLDGSSNQEIYPFLPYLLQDLDEIGTDPRMAAGMIERHVNRGSLNILDLGCGKGAVTVHLAKTLDCHITGIDGMPEFIESAGKLATKNGVSHLCRFIHADIREEIKNCRDFDVVILGAIGPVFGLMGQTLQSISPALRPGGYVFIDDGFKEDDTLPGYDRVLSRSAFYQQIEENGFRIAEELIIPPDKLHGSNREIQDMIVMRAGELLIKYPDKEKILRDYVQAQEDEIDTMENHLKVGAWLLEKNEG